MTASLDDARDEAVGRLTIVLRLLQNHDCDTECHHQPKGNLDGDGSDGYDLGMAVEALRYIRTLLKDAGAEEQQTEAA
jgi:hypothetical protein